MSNAISPAWTSSAHGLPNRHNAASNNSRSDKTSIRSPLLFGMLEKLSPENRHSILDIGQASASSIDYFNDYWCKLFITDSVREIHSLSPESIDTSHKWYRALVKTIQFYKRNRQNIDVILLWDLPNYLPADRLQELIHYLLAHTSDKALLHTYMHNSRKMPVLPANYHIENDQTVTIQTQSIDQLDCPMYHQTELQKYLKPFKVDHSVMLSSGIQEYLFHLD